MRTLNPSLTGRAPGDAAASRLWRDNRHAIDLGHAYLPRPAPGPPGDHRAEIASWVAAQAVGKGLLTLYIRHTNADPDVQVDLEALMAGLVPEDTNAYRHITEGFDDSPAYIKGALTNT